MLDIFEMCSILVALLFNSSSICISLHHFLVFSDSQPQVLWCSICFGQDAVNYDGVLFVCKRPRHGLWIDAATGSLRIERGQQLKYTTHFSRSGRPLCSTTIHVFILREGDSEAQIFD